MPIISRRRRAGSVVGPSVADHLAYTTSPGTGGASPWTVSPIPVVAAKKADGSTDTSYAGAVTLTLNVLSGSPVLSGTTTKALASGVADFAANGLTITGAGTWTLTASLAGLASATSSTGTTTSGGLAAITDAFNRADNASTLGTTDTGQTWTYPGGNTCGISTNQAYVPSVASTVSAVIDRTTANMTVQATMVKWKTSGGNTGLVFRCIDGSNYWYTQIVGNQIYVNKVVSGTSTNAQIYTPSTTPADGDTLTVSVDASNLITLKINGTTIGSFTDAANSTGTKAGFGGNPVAADRWDNFSCTSP